MTEGRFAVRKRLIDEIQARLDANGQISAGELAGAAAAAGVPPESVEMIESKSARVIEYTEPPARELKEQTMPKRCIKIESDEHRARVFAEHADERLVEIRIPNSEEEEYRAHPRAFGFAVDDGEPADTRYLLDAETHAGLVRQYPFLAQRSQETQRDAEVDAAYRAFSAAMGFDCGEAA